MSSTVRFANQVPPHQELPPAKRKRPTHSQPEKKYNTRSQQLKSQNSGGYLPSPGSTIVSSDLISSSSIQREQKESTQSFRDRILPRAIQPKAAVAAAPKTQNHTQRTESLAETSPIPQFYQRVAASFQLDRQKKAANTVAESLRPQPRDPFPHTDPEAIIKQLQDYFLKTAKTLYDRTTKQLQQSSTDLDRRFQDVLQGDDIYLARIRKEVKELSSPISESLVRSEKRNPDGTVSKEIDTIGAIVTSAQTEFNKIEGDIFRLWREWAEAEAALGKAYKEIFSDAAPAVSKGPKGPKGSKGGAKAGKKDILARFEEVVKKEIEEVEEELDQLSESAVAAMKEIEKEYRKATLPDQLIFFQSIDEP
ncbi:hypothetical protein B0T19DRAFT_424226 [Cercophora scortea]|uniref:Uncharacterized protein n=1 Tax=Cercophora scortea TaxID=314031 RepID=A0AAE0ME32_9PEZI|nr:hypothetical protein B0T19DRAFT_424226 [Cercophora scortea]